MNLTIDEANQLFRAIKEQKISISEAVERIKNKGQFIEPYSKLEEIILTIDYNQSLKRMIALGRYDYKNIDIIEKNFPLPIELKNKKVTVSGKLFYFEKSISGEDAISEMEKVGYRPATLVELLALGVKYPEMQRQFPIIALGSIWRSANNCRYSPYLYVSGRDRELNFDWFGASWSGFCRFLAICK